MPTSRASAGGRWLVAKRGVGGQSEATSRRAGRRGSASSASSAEGAEAPSGGRGREVDKLGGLWQTSGPALAILGLCLLSLYQIRIYLALGGEVPRQEGPPLPPSLALGAARPEVTEPAAAKQPRVQPRPALPPPEEDEAEGGPAGEEEAFKEAWQAKLSANGKAMCTHMQGYANDKIVYDAVEHAGYMSSYRCSEECAASEKCNCWSWKDDGFCNMGRASTCTYTGSPDDARWRFGSCSNEHLGQPPPAQAKSLRGRIHGRAHAVRPAPGPAPPADGQWTCEAPAPPEDHEEIVASNSTNATTAGELTDKALDAIPVIPLLIICHARPVYLRRALESVFRHRKNPKQFPVTASQDGDHKEVARILQEELSKGRLAAHLRYRAPLALSSASGSLPVRKSFQRLAAHYLFALKAMLGEGSGHEQLIVLEEDLEISPDFYAYFEATLPLLRADPCLFCVSAWNENGKPSAANDTKAIYRSDFFPGLGWMLLRPLWLELRSQWPNEYWDEYLRRSNVRKGRQCLRPEVSRARTFGEVGVSKGKFYASHLRHVRLNLESTNWTSMDLSYVSTAPRFDDYLSQEISGSDFVILEDLSTFATTGEPRKLAILYEDRTWIRCAKFFGLPEDQKDGVRRGTYRGVLALTWQRHKVYLVRDWPILTKR